MAGDDDDDQTDLDSGSDLDQDSGSDSDRDRDSDSNTDQVDTDAGDDFDEDKFDKAADEIANLVDRSVEFFLPVEEFSAGWLAIRSEDACSDVTLIADRVVIAEKFAESGGVDCFGVMSAAGKRIGDMHQVLQKDRKRTGERGL